MATQTSRAASGRVLLTGGSGHLGANLLRRLLAGGESVRVLVREGSNNRGLDGLDVERVVGDLRDADAVSRAVRGCARVYHCAAKVSTLEGDASHKREVFETNVLGTKHVLSAARRNDVERVVVTGSFSAVGYDHKDPSRASGEEEVFYPFHHTMPYEASKAFVEHMSWKAAAQGLDVVVATSCAIIGANDWKPSRMGKTLCDFANGKMWSYIAGGFPWVCARDIVEGHVLSMQKGRKGEKYIFASEFLTTDELLGYFEEVTGRARPSLRLPAPVMYGIARASSTLLTRFFPTVRQRLTPGAIRILVQHRHADTSKAQEELGFEPTPVVEGIRDAYEWFASQGHIHSPRVSAQVPRAAARA
jgi:nucleoside-diphosphate-sugar epimerase